ncbi:hypothetical protein ACFSE0_12500 [Ochrobactrum teleogrylli]|uniref:Uncharacterized protein n=1 Tax=Ochrobactrum teleogrylli TaxID=2479765 RepID=A0ABY2Y3F2_9HYPH|nr:hypothetical protein [[Ochrobactrum] teleogrylli]TNV15843.1 hypothetical protein FIC94_11185 [[Ochrobactrum] teleogrylli]
MSNIEVSNIEVINEGGGDHYYRIINFHALGKDRIELLDVDGDLCLREDSQLYADDSLDAGDAKNIRQQLIDWLEANPQSDLTEEAALTPTP